MSKNEVKYITFPIDFIPDVYLGHEHGNRMVHFGLIYYADKVEYYMGTIIRHLIYCNYHKFTGYEGRPVMPMSIQNELRKYDFEWFGKDDDFEGFIGGEGAFDPAPEEVEEIEKILLKNDRLLSLVIRLYKVSIGIKDLGLNPAAYDYEYLITDSWDLLKAYENSFRTTISIDVLRRNVMNNYNDTNRDILAMYLSIRSELNYKRGYKIGISQKALLAHMVGYTNYKDVPEDLPEQLQRVVDRYFITNEDNLGNCKNRRRRNKLIEQTCNAFTLNWYRSKGSTGLNISEAKTVKYDKLKELVESKKNRKEIGNNDYKAMDFNNHEDMLPY